MPRGFAVLRRDPYRHACSLAEIRSLRPLETAVTASLLEFRARSSIYHSRSGLRADYEINRGQCRLFEPAGRLTTFGFKCIIEHRARESLARSAFDGGTQPERFIFADFLPRRRDTWTRRGGYTASLFTRLHFPCRIVTPEMILCPRLSCSMPGSR